MANIYTPSDGSGSLSLWQQRIYDAARAREAAAQAAWSYPYSYNGSIIKQTNTTKTTGDTFSIDPELQFVGKPNGSYAVIMELTFSGNGYGSFSSGITVGLSGTSYATGNTYESNYGYYYLTTGSPTYFTGNSTTISGVNTNRVTVRMYTSVDISSDITAWGGTPPAIGAFWNMGGVTAKSVTLRTGSGISWYSTAFSG